MIEAARLQVIVEADTKRAESGLRGMDSTVQKSTGSFGGLSGAVKNFALAAGVGGAATAALKLATAAAEDAASVARLNTAVRNASDGLIGHTQALEQAVTSGQALAFSDDEIRNALTQLTQQTGSADEAMRRLSTAQDLARGAGIDLASASKLLGKVTDESHAALTRLGIQVDKNATAQEVLNEVDKRFAGQAGTFAESDAGKLAIATDRVEELKEMLGSGLLPMVVNIAGNVTVASDAILDMGESFQIAADSLTGMNTNLPGFMDFVTNMPLGLNQVAGSLTAVSDGVGWFTEKLGLAEESGVGFSTTFNVIKTAINESEAAAAAAAAELDGLALSTDRGRESSMLASEAGQAYRESLGRQAEAAGLANERNSEMALGIELGSGAAAEAAFNLDKLNEAAGRAWEGQQALTLAWNDATSAVGFWEGNLSNAEKALEILTSQGITSGTEFDILTGAVGRYTGGIVDSEAAVVDAAVAQANFITKQDELNTKLANGTITQADYNTEMGAAVGKIDPATGAAYNLATAQDGLATAVSGAVTMVRDLLIELGLIPAEKKTDVSVPGADAAKQHLRDINEAANDQSFTVTPVLDSSFFFAELEGLRGYLPASPAKEGPFSKLPDWTVIMDSMPAAMAVGLEVMEDGLADMAALMPSGTGGDGLGIIADMMPDRDSLRMKLMGEWDAILSDVEGILNGDVQERLTEALDGLQDQLALAVALGAPQSVVEGINASIAETEAQLALVGEVYAKAIAAGMTSEEAQAEAEAAAAALFQIPIGQLQVAMANMNDGGLALVDELVAGVVAGNASFEDAMSTLTQMVEFATDDLVETTGVAADDLLAQLEQMEDALLVDFAEALLTGTDPAGIEANLAIISQLLAMLRAEAAATAAAVAAVNPLGTYNGGSNGMGGTNTSNGGGTGKGDGSGGTGYMVTGGGTGTSTPSNIYVTLDSEPIAAVISRKIMPAPSIVGW